MSDEYWDSITLTINGPDEAHKADGSHVLIVDFGGTRTDLEVLITEELVGKGLAPLHDGYQLRKTEVTTEFGASGAALEYVFTVLLDGSLGAVMGVAVDRLFNRPGEAPTYMDEERAVGIARQRIALRYSVSSASLELLGHEQVDGKTVVTLKDARNARLYTVTIRARGGDLTYATEFGWRAL